MSDSRKSPSRRDMLGQALLAIEKLEQKLADATAHSSEPVAIIGLSCRYPGADSAEQFWQLLEDGIDAVGKAPMDRWKNSQTSVDMSEVHGGFLRDLDQFDAAHFGISGREAESMDPQQRLMLEQSWEAIEHAGIAVDTLRNSKVGVYVGITTNDYAQLAMSRASAGDVYTATGGALNVAAGRIAFALGFNGPAISVDTACSSSLVALHLACQGLSQHDCDAALAGGVNVVLSAGAFACFADWGMMAPDGRCKTFDEKADGFVRSEGCGVVLLKRLSDALASGDNILAIVRGSAVNQDGASSGLTVPNGLAQETVLRDALRSAGLEARAIDYVEAHGTGTTLGDPIELEALGNVLGRDRPAGQPLLVGSVKTNIGHAESAAGMAGLIKAVLSLQHESLPRNLHFNTLSSRIALRGAAVAIPTATTPWPRGERPRIAGISSFGFSGTNGHVIIEEGPKREAAEKRDLVESIDLLVLSARNDDALGQLGSAYAEHLAANPGVPFCDVCYSAATGRARLARRAAVVADSVGKAVAALQDLAAGRDNADVIRGAYASRPKIGFLFTGQGSQHLGMGRDLFHTETVFRSAIEQCARLLEQKLDSPLTEILGYDGAGTADDRLHQTRFTQPALFAFEYALAQLWRAYGVEPSAVAGHSLGEYVAACVAGVMSLEDALPLVAERARLMQQLPQNGSMVAVLADEETVSRAIGNAADAVVIAAVNAPQSIVISGDTAQVAHVQNKMAAEGIETRKLQVSHAFHSPLMQDMLAEFAACAERIEYRPPAVDLVLNVDAALCGEQSISADYWTQHIVRPVQFAASVSRMRELGIESFVEIGPAPVLVGLAGQTIGTGEAGLFASVREGEPARAQILASLGGLFVRGLEPNWQAINSGIQPRRVDLPRYPFQRKHFWVSEDPAPMAAAQFHVSDMLHPFLGRKMATPLGTTLFDCSIRLSAMPTLRDHRIAGLTLFPAAAYMEMGRAAASELFARSDVTVADGWFREPLVLDDERLRQIQLVASHTGKDEIEFEIFSRLRDASNDEDWTRHAGGVLRSGAPESTSTALPEEARKRCTTAVDVGKFQSRMRDVGLEYGPSFRGLTDAWVGGNEAFGRLRLPAGDDLVDTLVVHPAILDAAFHLLGVAMEQQDEGERFYLPVGYESAVLHRSPGCDAEAYVQLRHSDSAQLVADITLWCADGSLAAEVLGLQARGMSRDEFQSVVGCKDKLFHEIVWQETELECEAPDSQGWLVLGGDDGLRRSVVECLQRRGLAAEPASDLPPQAEAGFFARIIDLRACESAGGDGGSPAEEALQLLRWFAASTVDDDKRLLLVTRFGQSIGRNDCVDPAATAVWGLAATAAAEMAAADIRILDIDASTAPDVIVDAATSKDHETRFGCRSSQVYVPRLTEVSAGEDQRDSVLADVYSLRIAERGSLAGVELQKASRTTPGAGQVEIEVLASGINFRDVLNVLDMYPGPAGEPGNECCGRIVSVGTDVDEARIGTLVTCIAEATYDSHVIAEAELTFPVPDTLSIAQAAVFPIAQLTAYLALHEIGRIRTGQRVLIHAGAGGVGLAAIHIAHAAGAEVIATAGSESKRQFLRSLGVAHVFDSRQVLSSATVLEATGGRGVELVLNSLIGESIDAGIESLAPGGQFLEIGMREIRNADEVAMIRGDISYYPILLGDYCRHEPQLVRRMFAELRDLLQDGRIPAPAVRSFPISDVVDAFEFMAKALHIGRLAVMHPAVGTSAIRDDSSYIVTGGMGALGLHVAEWLVSRGATYLVLMGRNAPDSVAAQRIDVLRQSGAAVEIALGDVADSDGLPLPDNADRPPVRGVVHAAGIVDDSILQHVDADRLHKVLRPKLGGVENLLQATRDIDLDFLVLFSSGSAILGSPGQIAYSAANAYLDGTAHQLRSQGRRAISINWGAWGAVGMAADLDAKRSRDWTARGINTISIEDGLAALETAIGMDRPQIAVLPVNWAKFFAALGNERVPAFLSCLQPNVGAAAIDETAVETSFREKLAGVSDKRRLAVVTQEIRREVAAVLSVPVDEVDLRAGLTEQGMDSLMAVELAGRLGRLLGLSLPTTFAFDHPTLNALAAFLEEKLAPKPEVSPDHAHVTSQLDSLNLDAMSEADLEAALRSELEQTEVMES